jgi:hypothetical protein
VDAAAGTISTDQQVIVLDAEREVTFGRDPHVGLRIGHVPVYDDVVPKLAGKVFVHDGRVVVANLHRCLAFDIRVEGRPLISVPPGDWHSPREGSYDVLVTGTFTYELAVTVNTGHNPTRVLAADAPTAPDPPTGARPRLSERQRHIPRRLRRAPDGRGRGGVAPAGGRDRGHQPVAGEARVPPHLERASGRRRAHAHARRRPRRDRRRLGPPPLLTPTAGGRGLPAGRRRRRGSP